MYRSYTHTPNYTRNWHTRPYRVGRHDSDCKSFISETEDGRIAQRCVNYEPVRKLRLSTEFLFIRKEYLMLAWGRVVKTTFNWSSPPLPSYVLKLNFVGDSWITILGDFHKFHCQRKNNKYIASSLPAALATWQWHCQNLALNAAVLSQCPTNADRKTWECCQHTTKQYLALPKDWQRSVAVWSVCLAVTWHYVD